jgi:hypothetical protein
MRAWLVSLVFVTGTIETRAEQIPAILRGNSAVLSWSDSRTVKDMEGRQKNVDQTSEIKLYISEQGRVFSRSKRRENTLPSFRRFRQLSALALRGWRTHRRSAVRKGSSTRLNQLQRRIS